MRYARPSKEGYSAHRFVVLDGLRGVAAFSVVLLHLPGQEHLVGARSHQYLAVDLFFVLSGFVLAQAYDERFVKGMTVLAFMRARIIRLFPLTTLATVIATISYLTLLFLGQESQASLQDCVPCGMPFNLFMLPAKTSAAAAFALFPYNGPEWSLFLELMVNLLFVVFWRWTRPQHLIPVMGIAFFSLVAISSSMVGIDGGWSYQTFWTGVARVMFSFPAGILLYRHVPRTTSIMPALSLVITVVTLNLITFGEMAAEVYDIVFISAISPLVVWLGASARQAGCHNVMSSIGHISYAVYVLQLPIIFLVWHVAVPLFGTPKAHFWSLLGLTLILTIALSWLATTLFDVPVRQKLAQIWKLKNPGYPVAG